MNNNTIIRFTKNKEKTKKKRTESKQIILRGWNRIVCSDLV